MIPPNVIALMGGQSNNSGRNPPPWFRETPTIPNVSMVTNAGTVELATPDSDNNLNQIDTVSLENLNGYNYGYDFGANIVRLSGLATRIIARPKGGTDTFQWQPNVANYQDRNTLFGSALYWGMAYGFNLLLWSQAEANVTSYSGTGSGITNYTSETQSIFNAFRAQRSNVLNPLTQASETLPIIMMQLPRYNPVDATGAQNIRNQQRLFHSDVNRIWVIPTHDLQMYNFPHLGDVGHFELGRRVALMYCQKVLGYAINGEGPRLSSITKPTATTVLITLTRDIVPFATRDDDTWWVLSDGSGSLTVTNIAVGTNTITLTVNRAITGTLTVNYWPNATGPILVYPAPALLKTIRDYDGLTLLAFIETL